MRALVNRISELEKALVVKDAKIATLESAQVEALRRVKELDSKHFHSDNPVSLSSNLMSATNSSMTMLDNLSDAKSDESVVLVNIDRSHQSHVSKSFSSDESTTPPVPISVVNIVKPKESQESQPQTAIKPSSSNSAQIPFSLDEEEDDGWT